MRVLTFGTFDHLHPGHLSYLSQAQKKGELFVVIARDENVRKIKNLLPDHTEEERAAAVRAAFPRATVVLGDAHDFSRPLRDLKPDLLILGYDQHLPPGLSEASLPCPIERAEPFEPHLHKSSFKRKK